MMLIGGTIAIFIAFLVLIQPFMGIVLTVMSLPIVGILPKTFISSTIFPLIGTLTLFSFLLNRNKVADLKTFKIGKILIVGGLFFMWIFLTHPKVAVFGWDRNWMLTLFQLWLLAWMTSELLDKPYKHHVLMWAFSISAIISALIAIKQGNIGTEIDPGLRVKGLAEGANTAARYYVLGMIFLTYLRTKSSNPIIRVFALGGMIITFFGVFFTVSRTGILLLGFGIMMLIWLQATWRYKFQIMFIVGITGLLLWNLSENIFTIIKSIAPAIQEGTDTVGLRFSLWIAGWRMWIQNPIQGVGIGMYPRELRYVARDLMAPMYYKGAVAHNMYIQILAETGIVGFCLFMYMIIKTLKSIWHANHTKEKELVSLKNIWFIAFLIMILGGLSKSDQAEKMIWMMMGIGIFMDRDKSGKENSGEFESHSYFQRIRQKREV